MKKFLLPVLAAALLVACETKQPAKVDTAQLQTALMDADKAFNTAVVADGFQKASEKFYAEDVIVIMGGQSPLIGMEAVKKDSEAHPDTVGGLSWAVEKAAVAESGDLGWTWGRWQWKGKNAAGTDTTTYGDYSTVWKKTTDGSWKAVLDHASKGPKPE